MTWPSESTHIWHRDPGVPFPGRCTLGSCSPPRSMPLPVFHTRVHEQLCQYYGSSGHHLSNCSLKATLDCTPSTICSTIPAILSCREKHQSVLVLLDSGADGSFICPSLVRLVGPSTGSLQQPLCINALTGALLKIYIYIFVSDFPPFFLPIW